MIVITLDVALGEHNARRQARGLPRMTMQQLAEEVGITPPNLSNLKNGHFTALRRSTLDAICRVLACQPGDLLRWVPGEDPSGGTPDGG